MRKKPIIIGATGGSDGGKTSVPKAILANFRDQKIAVIQHDSYCRNQSHLTFEKRVSTNYNHPFTFDTDLMIEHINGPIAGRPVGIPIYDHTQHARNERTYRREPQDVFIIKEILAPEDKHLHDLMGIKLFVDTDDDIRIIHRTRHDVEERGRSLDSIIDRYTSVIKPMYHQFIEPTEHCADIIIPEGASDVVAIDLINTEIATILE